MAIATSSNSGSRSATSCSRQRRNMRPALGICSAVTVLESAPKARAHWQAILGEDFPIAEQALRPTDEIARIYPCSPKCATGHGRKVHDWCEPIAATCRDDRCDEVRL